MPRGRLETYCVVPAGGWPFSATNGTGGPSTCTVAAGEYTVTTLCTAVQNALNAGRPSGWTVTRSFGESGTGLITINCSSVNWSITWTTVELGQLLGHSNITSRASSLAGSTYPPGLWLPDCPYWSPYDQGDAGARVTDMRQNISPTGTIQTLYGNYMTVLKGLKWEAVTKQRTRAFNEATTIQSFENWWINGQLGSSYSSMAPGSKIGFFPTADADTCQTYRISDLTSFEPPQTAQGWTGLFRIEIPKMVIAL